MRPDWSFGYLKGNVDSRQGVRLPVAETFIRRDNFATIIVLDDRETNFVDGNKAEAPVWRICMHYAVVDIGSPKQGNLGWWVTGPLIEDGGTGPEDLIANLTEAVRLGPVVLGFEAPMYVPTKRDIRATIQQRPGEAGRPWSAGAGASVTAMALALVPAILDRIASNVPGQGLARLVSETPKFGRHSCV